MAKPKQRTVRIVLNSGANIHAKNKADVTHNDLGFYSWEDWDDAGEDEKYKAVADYWAGMGFPEIYWEDGDDTSAG